MQAFAVQQQSAFQPAATGGMQQQGQAVQQTACQAKQTCAPAQTHSTPAGAVLLQHGLPQRPATMIEAVCYWHCDQQLLLP
jgi:hypothetical protein